MNAAKMFARCRDRQAAYEDEREAQLAVEIGRALRAGGFGTMRSAEAPDSPATTRPEPMGNGEAGSPMEAM